MGREKGERERERDIYTYIYIDIYRNAWNVKEYIGMDRICRDIYGYVELTVAAVLG